MNHLTLGQKHFLKVTAGSDNWASRDETISKGAVIVLPQKYYDKTLTKLIDNYNNMSLAAIKANHLFS